MSDTPKTNAFVLEMQAAHRRKNLDDFDHYFEATGDLANFSRQLETELTALREQLKDCSAAFDRQQKQLDRNAEQIAALREALSRLIEVHDAMGGVCGTARIAAEEALLGKAHREKNGG